MVSRDSELNFYPDSIVEKKGCHLSRLAIVGIVIVFIVSLLIVGLSVGLTKNDLPECDTTTTTTTSTTIRTTTENPEDEISYRLPRSVFPLHYDLEMRPDLENKVFDGRVNITLDCKEDTDNITMNLDGLTFNVTALSGPEGNVDITNIMPVPEKYLLVIKADLKKGNQYNLDISFHGKLLNNLMGLYYGTYEASDGTTRTFAATQFESTRARKALPCFDEPLYKAEFSVTLLRKKTHRCLSNMESIGTEIRDGDWIAERFNRSVRMSSYLLAMYVGDLEDTPINSALPIEMRVWAREDGINKTEFVKQIADEQMTGFQDYFDIPYALTKMDHVGLPEMGPGAMENYGLIKYRESYIIIDENSSPEAKQSSAFIFAHEIGHQWFGNLVTMVWWDDIWLNEGFANLCEYIGMEIVRPEWKPWEQFLFRTMGTAMNLDSLRNSRVIRHDANTPDEISANFDAIAYRKGASILRMVRDLMGHDKFKLGIRQYLRDHMYNNTVSDDLWRALADQTGTGDDYIDVTKVMHTWTLQMNYPLINVTRNYGNKNALAQQSRFLLDSHNDTMEPDGSHSEFGYKWIVPLTYMTESEAGTPETPSRYLLQDEEVVLNNTGSPDEWLIVNVKRTGAYRVNYDEQNWDLLIDQLNRNHTVLPPENRAQIVDDALQLARAGHLSQTLALKTTQYLVNETDLTPWKTAEEFLLLMHEILARTRVYGLYKKYMVQLVSPLLAELGWEDEGEHLKRMLRGTLINLACLFGHKECVSNAKGLYKQWMDNDTMVSANVQSVVYCTAIREGGLAEWDFAWTKFMNENSDPVHRGVLRDAMTCSNQLWILARYLSWASDTNKIKRGESDIVLVGIAQNPIGRPLVWQVLQEHWAGSDDAIYGKKRIADNAFNGFYTRIDVQQLEEFRDKYINDHANAKHLIFGAVEKAWVSYRWITDSLNEMERWFIQATSGAISE